jgi:hypothetical protein
MARPKAERPSLEQIGKAAAQSLDWREREPAATLDEVIGKLKVAEFLEDGDPNYEPIYHGAMADLQRLARAA